MDSSFFLFGLSHIARSGNTKPGAARSRPKGSKKRRGKTNGRVQDRIEDTPLLAGSRQRPESALHFRRKQSRFVIRRTPSRHRSHCPVSRPFDPHLFLSCVFLVSISFTPFPSLVLHAYSLYPPLGTDHFSVTSGKSWAGWGSLRFFPLLKTPALSSIFSYLHVTSAAKDYCLYFYSLCHLLRSVCLCHLFIFFSLLATCTWLRYWAHVHPYSSGSSLK